LFWGAAYLCIASSLLMSFATFSCPFTDLIVQDDIFSLTKKGFRYNVCSACESADLTLCGQLSWGISSLYSWLCLISLQVLLCKFYATLWHIVFARNGLCVHMCVSHMKVMIWCSVSNSCEVLYDHTHWHVVFPLQSICCGSLSPQPHVHKKGGLGTCVFHIQRWQSHGSATTTILLQQS
jgi:hypothetical protein